MTDPKIYDLSISSSESIESEEGLRTAITLSLLTDARALPDDVIPDPTDRKGWWADTYSDRPGDAFGSRLWVLQGRPMSSALVAEAEDMIRQSLQWLIDDGYASTISVDLEIVADSALGATIGVYRPQEPAPWFEGLWEVSLAA